MNLDNQKAAGETLAAQDKALAVKGNSIVDTTVLGAVLRKKLAKVNGTIVMPCLIESGSSSCLLRESAAKSSAIQWTNHTAVIYGFGAQAITNVLGKANVSLKIDEAVLDDVPVFIVPDDSCSRDFIIGRPWCESPRVAYIKYGNNLKFYHTNEFPFVDTDTSVLGVPSSKLVVENPVTLRAHQVALVDAKLGGMSVRVPICNPMPEEEALKANQMFARRSALVSSPTSEQLPFSRDLTYDDIVHP